MRLVQEQNTVRSRKLEVELVSNDKVNIYQLQPLQRRGKIVKVRTQFVVRLGAGWQISVCLPPDSYINEIFGGTDAEEDSSGNAVVVQSPYLPNTRCLGNGVIEENSGKSNRHLAGRKVVGLTSLMPLQKNATRAKKCERR